MKTTDKAPSHGGATAIPFPLPEHTDLTPPGAEEVASLGRGVLTAVSVDGQPTEFQRLLVEAVFEAMTGHQYQGATFQSVEPEEFARGMAARNQAFRARIVQIMILGALVLRPLPIEVADRVAAFAVALSIDDGMLEVARDFAAGDLGLAAVDFDRNGYTADWSPERTRSLHASGLDDAWALAARDDELAAKWEALAELPAGTLGRGVWEFYRSRGFQFPGRPGSAPPLLAQHDWVHVLADYGTKVESELEVFGFIARANDDARGFSLLAMVVSLFETGYLAHGAGLFDAFPGQLSRDGMAVRVADAMRRGALSHEFGSSAGIDFLGVDWFELADQPLTDLRTRFGIPAKSDRALAAGSIGPCEPGGISEYQYAAGQAAAASRGETYDPHGATP